MRTTVLVGRAPSTRTTWVVPVRIGLLSALCIAMLFAFAPPARAASGALIWQRAYNGTGNGEDQFSAVAPAPNGGAYVGGITFVDNEDFVVARYDAGGHRRWLRTYNGSGDGYDELTAAASDGNGNLVVVGYSPTASATVVTAVIKYGPAGQRRWVRTFGSSTLIPDASQSIAVDRHGNIYVAGTEYDPATSYNIVVAKYSSAGVRRWVRRYVGPGTDLAGDLALDGAGNVYVTGDSQGTTTGADVLTLKYDPAGHRRWARRWDGGSGDDGGSAIAVTKAGAVYVAGTSASGSGYATLLLKYTTGGSWLWSREASSGGATDDYYHDVATLANGDVVAVGSYYDGTADLADAIVTRYAPTGAVRWSQLYNGPDSLNDMADHVARGPAGAIFVSGRSQGATTGTDILTLKYSGAGHLRWARRHSGAGAGGDSDTGLIVGGRSVYVAGYQQAGSTDDGVLLRYKP